MEEEEHLRKEGMKRITHKSDFSCIVLISLL